MLNSSTLSCMNYTSYHVSGSIHEFISLYIFPTVCIIGIGGTILNLIVLNGREMKSKTNCFLSAMAVADFFFFVIMFFTNLISYNTFSDSKYFSELYYGTKIPLTALTNCLSSSSIWFAVMLTLERLIAIRTPLHAHLFWRKYKPAYIIILICLLSFLSQIYYFFWLKIEKYPNCEDKSKLINKLRLIRQEENVHHYYFVKYSVIVVPVITVTVPVMLLVVFNILLLYYLRLSRKELQNLRKSKKLATSKEWKITTTVLAIVLTLVLFNLPSVIYYWISIFTVYRSSSLVFLSNFIILISKALNFILYCTISSNFRRGLFRKFVSKAKTPLKYRRSFDTHMILTCKPSGTQKNYEAAQDYEDTPIWNGPPVELQIVADDYDVIL